MSTMLMTHRGSVRIGRAELTQIEPPAATDTWKPVAHRDLVSCLTEVLSTRGIQISREEYAIQRGGNVLFGVMDLAWGHTAEYCAALGLRTSNDKTLAIQIAIGARVVVCDNLLMSGELIALKRKHTTGLELANELQAGVGRYEYGYRQLGQGIERLKSRPMTLLEAREMVFTIFARRILPLKLFQRVAPEYLDTRRECRGITAWDVTNSCTTALKQLPSPAIAFESHVKLGKFFGLN